MGMLEIFLYCAQSKLGCFLLAELSLVYVAEINRHLNLVSVSRMICQVLAVVQARGGAWDWRSKQDDAGSTLGRLGSSRRAGPGTVVKPFDDCFDKRGGALERRHEGHLTHSQG